MELSLQMTDVACSYLCLAQDICKLDAHNQYNFMKVVENYYEDQADSPLGDFLNEYVALLVEEGACDDLHQSIQDLVDDHQLDDEMLTCVADTIQYFYNEYYRNTVFVY